MGERLRTAIFLLLSLVLLGASGCAAFGWLNDEEIHDLDWEPGGHNQGHSADV
jgi:hypothetical protein